MLDHWISLLIRGRWIFATFLITAMAGSLWLMPQLNFSFNLGRMLRVADVRNFYSTFPPSDGHVMLSASADRVLTVNDLRATERWAEQATSPSPWATDREWKPSKGILSRGT
jgi:hypothetical protein